MLKILLQYPTTSNKHRLPFSLPFRETVFLYRNNLLVIIYYRDPFLCCREFSHYLHNTPPVTTLHDEEVFSIPGIKHMPLRYRGYHTSADKPTSITREPFTPATFFSYIEHFFVDNNNCLCDRYTRLPIMTKKPFIIFRDTFKDLQAEGLLDNVISTSECIALVEHKMGFSFIDEVVFTYHLLYGDELPLPHEFGLLGFDSWPAKQAMVRSAPLLRGGLGVG
ncbi:hypothetical protein Moror_14568 [Moniliophthora roreri MCA 2997]|uniref:Uncharacterized protein n=1 Tax=Moniliophthora roreri (strain MCA 2997) TaxID=1381753 RepID=V2XLA8_MONRO|nr:hypothetical protein Moror_14568 [Moniliophthora roreri MCA 2997]